MAPAYGLAKDQPRSPVSPRLIKAPRRATPSPKAWILHEQRIHRAALPRRCAEGLRPSAALLLSPFQAVRKSRPCGLPGAGESGGHGKPEVFRIARRQSRRWSLPFRNNPDKGARGSAPCKLSNIQRDTTLAALKLPSSATVPARTPPRGLECTLGFSQRLVLRVSAVGRR